MMKMYLYNSVTTEGVFVDPLIERHLGALFSFVSTLKSLNMILISKNIDGVIIEKIEDKLIDRFELFKTEIESKLNKMECAASNTLEKAPIVEEEVSDSFYLLFDFLPEKIRKELKIYIKRE